MDVSDKLVNLESLKMAKKHDQKVYITDIAINKVPFIQEVDDMESYVLNDVEYDFKPLEIFVPDPNYKVDEKELEKSIEKIWLSQSGQGRAGKGICRRYDAMLIL